mmetsp:Transcript_11779/g.27829  ORF Transcript_11779/g.27829 Transcript_11779/m.27829 type:complete len:224 (+) Transcript_11779:770-1441(+)
MVFMPWLQSRLRRRRSRRSRHGRPKLRPVRRLVAQLQQQSQRRRRPHLQNQKRRWIPLLRSLVTRDRSKLSSLSLSPREYSRTKMTTMTISTTLAVTGILPNFVTSDGICSICCTATTAMRPSAPTKPPSTSTQPPWRRGSCRRPLPVAGRHRYPRCAFPPTRRNLTRWRPWLPPPAEACPGRTRRILSSPPPSRDFPSRMMMTTMAAWTTLTRMGSRTFDLT